MQGATQDFLTHCAGPGTEPTPPLRSKMLQLESWPKIQHWERLCVYSYLPISVSSRVPWTLTRLHFVHHCISSLIVNEWSWIVSPCCLRKYLSALIQTHALLKACISQGYTLFLLRNKINKSIVESIDVYKVEMGRTSGEKKISFRCVLFVWP